MAPIEQLKQFTECRPNTEDGFPPELAGYAAKAAAQVLLQSWDAALAEGGEACLVTDIDDVIRQLNRFRTYAGEVLPRVNGGKLVFAGEKEAAK